MTTTIDIAFLWIPEHLGGHRAEPYVGMRLEVRWQRHIEDWLERAWDVECKSLSFDIGSSEGTGTFSFLFSDPLPSEWLREGEPIELLNGYRVLALARIKGSQSPE